MATVKKVAATADAARAEWNAKQTLKTQNAKSGGTARLMANATRYLDKNEPRVSNKKTVKIDSNPVKPGKTVVGPLAKGVASSGVAGLALGAVAAYKAELKAAAEAKKKKNRMN